MPDVFAIPLVYFDTNHIVEMIRWRRGKSVQTGIRVAAYEAISRAVTRGHVKLLFSPASCLEWVEGASKPSQWQEISEFFETAVLVEELESNFLYLAELVEETRRHFPSLSLPNVPYLRPVAEVPAELIQLATYHPQLTQMRGLPPAKSPGSKVGIQQWVSGSVAFAARSSDIMKERIEGWRNAVRATRDEFRRTGARHMSQSAKMEWANRGQHLGGILSLSDPSIDQIRLGALIDFDRLPACSLYLNSLWRYAKSLSDSGPDENDGDDWAQVPAIAYADFSLVERKLRNHLVAGSPSVACRLFNDPSEFATAAAL